MLDTCRNMSTAIVFIPVTQGHVAVVDLADFERVRGFKWCIYRQGRLLYAVRYFKNADGVWKQRRLHIEVTGWERADHRNGNGLDNRRKNLREFSIGQNLRSFNLKRVVATSRFRGVCEKPTGTPWMARIKTHDKDVYLGRFHSEEEAARAYDAAAKGLGFSDEALNFPPTRDADFAIL